MKGPAGGAMEQLPDSILEAAAIWYARMREPEADAGRAADRRRDFEAWLAADPRHERALEETERLWGALERPVAWALAAEARAGSRLQPAASPMGKAQTGKALTGKAQTGKRGSLRRRGAPRRAGWPLPMRVAAVAACLLLLVVAGGVWKDDIAIGLASDHASAVGERTPVTLADGSRILLNTRSAVAVDFGPATRHVRLLRGEAWFEVSSDAARPFTVETPQGSVRVTGTSFGVRRDEGATRVNLVEGGVALSLPGSLETLGLAPGQQAQLSAEGISDPAPFDRTAATAWLRGQLVFYDTPLAEVVASLNRYRPGRIVLLDEELHRLKVSGVFTTDDPDAALTVIADTLPVSVTRLTRYLVLLR